MKIINDNWKNKKIELVQNTVVCTGTHINVYYFYLTDSLAKIKPCR